MQKCATKVGSYYVLGTWNALGSWGFVLCILSTVVSSVFPDFPSSYLLLNILSIHQFMSWRIHSWCLLFSSPNIADIRWSICLRKGDFPKTEWPLCNFICVYTTRSFFSANEKLQSTNQGINLNKIVVE